MICLVSGEVTFVFPWKRPSRVTIASAFQYLPQLQVHRNFKKQATFSVSLKIYPNEWVVLGIIHFKDNLFHQTVETKLEMTCIYFVNDLVTISPPPKDGEHHCYTCHKCNDIMHQLSKKAQYTYKIRSKLVITEVYKQNTYQCSFYILSPSIFVGRQE